MKEFISRPFSAISQSIEQELGKEWMLITAQKPDGTYNTMTASWGGFGVLWNKGVAFCFVRPQRYTLEFLNASDTCTLSFFGGAHKEDLALLGRESGRNGNKIARTTLHAQKINGGVTFEEATRVFVCRKLYCQQLDKACFLDASLLKNYADQDYHYVFVCEIQEVLE